MPPEVIVPIAAEPPAVPFTAQVTAVLELPDTVAVNEKESPARMLAVVGVTLTEVDPGVEGVDGVEGLLFEPVVPLQAPLRNAIPSRTTDFIVGRIAWDTPRNRNLLTPIFDWPGNGNYWTED